ncbi:unnamed protein product, partial [marine sediment metagenome]
DTEFGVESTLQEYIQGIQEGTLSLETTKKFEKKLEQELDSGNQMDVAERVSATQEYQGLRSINAAFSKIKADKVTTEKATEADTLIGIGRSATSTTAPVISDKKIVTGREVSESEQLEDIANSVSTGDTPGARADRIYKDRLLREGASEAAVEAQLKEEKKSFTRTKKDQAKELAPVPVEDIKLPELEKELSDLRANRPKDTEPELQKIQDARIKEVSERVDTLKLGQKEGDIAAEKSFQDALDKTTNP